MILFSNFVLSSFTRNFLKKVFFPGDFEGAKFLKEYENNSQGIILVMISCRRVNRYGPSCLPSNSTQL